MADVKLLEPQRLTDNPDGGGLATATEVVDGQVNNLFPDISRIDRVNGEVSLRKGFIQATTADVDVFSGVHAIIQQPPADSRVSAVLFQTDGWGDERSDAKSLVERYLDASVITRMVPYDRQLAGQRTVIVYQRPELSLPDIGEAYVLTNESLATPTVEFIRVQGIASSVETFTEIIGGQPVDFEARVITLTITQPLAVEFAGSQPSRSFAAATGKSILRKTIVSDAARYKGITPLAADADIGDVTLRVASVYAQLSPAAASEAAVLDAAPAGATAVIPSGTSTLGAYSGGGGWSPVGIAPGSVGGGWFTDDGQGQMYYNGSPSGPPDAIDYSIGRINHNTGIVEYNFKPAALVSLAGVSAQQPVSQSTRGYVYTQSCLPLPNAGTVSVSYRAAGKWYELRDRGDGVLEGGVGVGSGQVNFATGTVVVTLGALPDIGSSVIFAWGGAPEFEMRTGDANVLPPFVAFTLTDAEVTPGTLSLAWTSGGAARTATASAAGVLSGHATGTIDYDTGAVRMRPTAVPDSSSTITATYNEPSAPFVQDMLTPTAAAGVVTLTSSIGGAIKAGSVRVYFPTTYPVGELYTFLLSDNGSGGLTFNGTAVAGASINYTTGVVTIPESITRNAVSPVYESLETAANTREYEPESGRFVSAFLPRRRLIGWVVDDLAHTHIAGAVTTLLSLPSAAAAGTGESEVFAMPPLQVDLTPDSDSTVVPGSVVFTYGGRTYYDRSGALYYAHNKSTNAGTYGGTINYDTGIANITSFVGGASGTLTKTSLLVQLNLLPLAVVHGRTPGSPLRPASFFVRALPFDGGAQISATADVNGNIDTVDMHGYVDITTGVFSIEFGRYVLDSGLTADDKAEPWYDVANIDGDGYIWRPREIIPGSLRFNCVIQTTLPLDPAIIGINPVRLPLDGRVQSIRPGDTLVIHDTVSDSLAGPISAAETRALSRTDLASVVLYDTDGVAVDPALYTTDLVAGEVTFADPLDLGAYTLPLAAVQTVEDMALCTDAQITGDIAIAQPLTRGYTAANSYVSSALVVGDAQARYQGLLELNTWPGDSGWALTSGAGPTSGAQYNDLTYPLTVLNRDCITQRWRLAFTSSTAFNIVSEELGIVGTGNTSTNVAPVNPATGQPYFTMNYLGFGTGWATGNTIRFDTVAAGAPIWVARTTRPGPAEVTDDQIKLQVRWDKD